MNEEKRFGTQGDSARTSKDAGGEDRNRNNSTSRARNRTVMLTPEMTGQVRALLYQDPEEEAAPATTGGAKRDPLTELLPPMDWNRPPDSAAPSEEYNRDLSSADAERNERPGSTGKIDTESVSEAMSAPNPDTPRRSAPAAQGQPSFSVNPNARQAAATPAPAPRRPDAGRPKPQVAPTSRVVGFFVTFDKNKFGEVYEIRAGRWLITSRPTDHGEYILIDDETVSPLHAIVRATKDGKVQVLDQLSEFGTAVKKPGQEEELEVSGTMVTVDHGDMLRLGERHFVVCLIPPTKVPEASEE